MTDATTIPCLPCVSMAETLDFYRALGFEVTYQQDSPNEYAVVHRGGCDLHFFGLKGLKPEEAYSTCLVAVSEVEPLHEEFSAGLRAKYGKFPVAGFPRITRFRKGQGRFTVVDPSGNSVIYIRRDEPDVGGGEYEKLSALAKAVEAAAYLRDSKGDDKAAAKVLDVALGRYKDAAPLDRARALAARAELAVAMGDAEKLRMARAELQQIPLSDEERERYRRELQAADVLEQQMR
jgi:catechol 2,3-dioxygenase-like lactoylglutathione lyase family enzyme